MDMENHSGTRLWSSIQYRQLQNSKKVFENEQAFSEALAKYGYQVKDTSLVYNPWDMAFSPLHYRT